MRILIDAVAAFSGAGPTHVRELAATLPTLDSASRFFFVTQPGLESVVRDLAPTVETLAPPPRWSRPPARLVWENLVIPRVAARWRADVVYSPFNTMPVVWGRPRPRLAVLLFNLAPYAEPVLRSLGVMTRMRLRTLRLVTDRTIDLADRIFVLSSQAHELVGERLSRDKTRMLRVSSPGTPRAQKPSVPVPDEPFFLVAGDLIPHKGMDVVIEALKYLPPGLRPLLLLCGRPLHREYAATLRRQIDEADMSHQVQMMGWVDHPTVLALMRKAVACIVPSRFENMSLVPFEAMAAGTVVIASAIPVFEESCGDAALYFRLENPHELADRLRLVLQDGRQRARLVLRGTGHVHTRGPTLSEQVFDSLLDLPESA